MRNSRGQLLTPVDAAVARGHIGTAQYLQLHGATSAAKLTDKNALHQALSRYRAIGLAPILSRYRAWIKE